MKKTKIKLMCWWDNSKRLTDRMKRQFILNLENELFEFDDDNPDYTIVLGGVNWDLVSTPKEKTFFISQEPVWSPNENKEILHNYCSKIFISDKREYPDRPEYIETQIPRFYGGADEINTEKEWEWSSKMFDYNYEKSKNISMVLTNGWSTHLSHFSKPETSRIIYVERSVLSDKFSDDLNFVNIWGQYQQKNGRNNHGGAWTKLIALKEYRFTICFENTIQKNYITEKFWDAVMIDTVPIYFGCNNIDEYIEPETFINLTNIIDDYQSIVKELNYINDNSEELYQKYLPKIKKLKAEFRTNPKYNLWEFIKKIITETL
jgi:hypothetical protein